MNFCIAMLLLCLATVVSTASVDDATTHFDRQASSRPDDVATVPNGQQLEALLGNITDFRLDRLAMRPPECEGAANANLVFCPMHARDDPRNWPCVRYDDLCDGVPNCPDWSDEHPTFCMFFGATRVKVSVLINALNAQRWQLEEMRERLQRLDNSAFVWKRAQRRNQLHV